MAQKVVLILQLTRADEQYRHVYQFVPEAGFTVTRSTDLAVADCRRDPWSTSERSTTARRFRSRSTGRTTFAQWPTPGAGRPFEEWIEAEVSALGGERLVVLRSTSDCGGQFPLFAKAGASASGHMLFVFTSDAETEYQMRCDVRRIPSGKWRELMTERTVAIDRDGCCTLPASPWGVSVLLELR